MVTYLGSLVQSCSEEGRTLQRNISGVFEESSHVWTTLGLPQLMTMCAFQVYTFRLQGSSQGYCPKQSLCFMNFPGLSCSGSGFQILHKGTNSVGHAFCALPSSEQPGDQLLGKHIVPGDQCVLITSLVLATHFPVYAARAPSQVCHAFPLRADLRLQPSWQLSTIQDPRKT